MELTEKMKETLNDVAYGVRLYRDGYFCIDEPDKRVDGRSLAALHRRGLIDWQGDGGNTYQIHIFLTELGNKVFEEKST